jgi:hypothetical protein
MYVCVYTRTYINIHVCIYTYIYTRARVRVMEGCDVFSGKSADPILNDLKNLIVSLTMFLYNHFYTFSHNARWHSALPFRTYIFPFIITCVIFIAPLSSPSSVYIRSSCGINQINSYSIGSNKMEGGGVGPLKV